MGSRNITKRFVVLFHGTPMESFDDEAMASRRMNELRSNQLRAWEEHWPMQSVDNTALWSVSDRAMLPKSA